jgi:hypothetical protein
MNHRDQLPQLGGRPQGRAAKERANARSEQRQAAEERDRGRSGSAHPTHPNQRPWRQPDGSGSHDARGAQREDVRVPPASTGPQADPEGRASRASVRSFHGWGVGAISDDGRLPSG